MKKRLLVLLLAISMMVIQLVPVAAADTSAANVMETFYVSPTGSDTNDGLSDAAPFASLEKAREEVAKINRNMTGDIVIYLMDGTWELDGTLTFGQSDSGTNGYYVRYEAAPGAKPMLSGGTQLAKDQWTLHDNTLGIYKMPLSRDRKLRSLYVNGERSNMASTESAIPARGTWGSYIIGDVPEVDDFTWSLLYSEDMENRSLGRIGMDDAAIKPYAKSGQTSNSVVNIIDDGSGQNKVIQFAHTANEDCGFEIPSKTYANALISYRVQFGANHLFTHAWEALHMHGANKIINEATGRTSWAGIKFAPHLSQTYFQYGTSGGSGGDDVTSQLNMAAFVAQPGTWYQIKMMVTADGYYYTKIWEDGKPEPTDWSRRETFGNLNDQDKFFRIYAYKNNNNSKMDVRMDDFEIQSGVLKDGGTATVLPDWAWATGTKFDGLLYDKAAFPMIAKNIEDVEIENQQVWNKNTVCVREMEAGSGNTWIMKLQQPYGAIAQTPGWGVGLSGSGNHVIRNAYEFLNKPGEFYFDRQDQMLYYIPRAGEDLSTADVIVPRLETIVEFKGTPVASGDLTTAGETVITGQVKNIVLKGVSVAYSDWGLQKIGNSYGKSTVQAGTTYTAFASDNWHGDMYRNLDTIPGAVEMEFAHSIRLLNGEVMLTGAEGVVLSNDVDFCEVTGNFIYQTGGSGVIVGNPQHVYENDSLQPDIYAYKAGGGNTYITKDGATADREKYQNGTERVPRDVKISNNLLLENCVLFPSHCPITSFYSQRMEVSNNHIRDAAYSGMSIGWGWCNFDGKDHAFLDWGTANNQGGSVLPGYPTETCFENKIINNRVDTVMTILHDGGLIYTLGKQDDTLIAYNFFENSQNQGIYQDEGSAYFKPIEYNVVSNAASSSIVAGEYGRKHDLLYRNNYANRDTVNLADKPSINIRSENFHYIADSIWPKEASDIIQNAGLTAEYRGWFADKLIDIYGQAENALLPESAGLDAAAGDTLTLNAWLEASDEIWLAPEGTAVFAEGPAMSKAAGNAADMVLPRTAGEYKLYVKQDGVFSGASNATVVVTKSAGALTSITYSSQIVNLVRGNAANIPVTVTGENLDGLAVWAALYDEAGSIVGSPVPVSAGKGLIRLSDIPTSGSFTVRAYIDGKAPEVSASISVVDPPVNLWKPSVTKNPNGSVTVGFASAVVLKSGANATVNGTEAAMTISGNEVTLVCDTVEGMNRIVISGVKYPLLYPSYSFKFTIDFTV